jgi:Caspase domain
MHSGLRIFPPMTRRNALLALALAVLAPPAPGIAQVATRSGEIGAPPERADGSAGRYLFAAVGINAYQAAGAWKPLDNPVNDVTAMREALRDRFKFESPDEWILVNEQATKIGIERLVDDLSHKLGPDDNLVFFYAGHGAELVDSVGGQARRRRGYIVPVSAKVSLRDAASEFIEIRALLSDLAGLPARHVLVILDSCYSGMALGGGNVIKMRGEETQQVQDLEGRVSRRVITSAQSDQLAADGGADFPHNSLFTGWFVEALKEASESDPDGVVTTTELYTFVRSHVGSASESRQTPDFGAFEVDDRGELVLRLDRDPFEVHYEEAVRAFDAGKLEAFATASAQALGTRAKGPKVSYLRFRSAQLDDQAADVLGALRELAAFVDGGDTIPLAPGVLALELRRAEKECARVGCRVPGGAQ